MIIHSNRIYMEDGHKAGYLEIEDRIIKNFYDENSAIKADIDYGNMRIIPGIFDSHNHGGFGYSVSKHCTKNDLKALLKAQASLGVVNYMPTTSGLDNIALIAEEVDKDQDGSRVLGVHSEGPWGSRVGEKGINTGYPKPDMNEAIKMYEAGKGKLKLVDIAPEVDGALDIIKYFVSKGVNVGIFHTNANYEEANKGIDAGASVATHLGNVMTGLHHRDVGTLGACLLRDEVDCEMICDGLHISLPMIQIYLRCKNHDQLMMVSDNVMYANLPVGRYKGMSSDSDRTFINITEEGFVLSDTGRLSGSSKPVIYGIKNLVEKLHVPMEECCKFFCYNPIRKYSNPNKKGSLKPGKDGDMVVIDDDYNVIATYSEGRIIYDCNEKHDYIKPGIIEELKV